MAEDICGQIAQLVSSQIQSVEVRNAPEEMRGKAAQVVAVQVEPLQHWYGTQMLLGYGGDVCELDSQQGGVLWETLRGELCEGNLITDHLISSRVTLAESRAGKCSTADKCQP